MANGRDDDCRATWVNLEAVLLVKMMKRCPGNTPGNFFESCIAAIL